MELHFVIWHGKKELLDPMPSLQEMSADVGVYRMLTDTLQHNSVGRICEFLAG